MHPLTSITRRSLAAVVAVLGAALLITAMTFLGAQRAAARSGVEASASATIQPLSVLTSPLTVTQTSTPTITPQPQVQLLPLLMSFRLPDFLLLDAWTGNAGSTRQQAFRPTAAIGYTTRGQINLPEALQVGLRWSQEGTCDAGEIFSNTVSLTPGDWEHTHPAAAPGCTGVFSSTVQTSYQGLTSTLTASYVVNPNSSILISGQQGFDRCYHPEVESMQTWWDNSPYSVVNLYIGGASYACRSQPLDAVWVHRVARQGWSFILTWVGPQAPCTSYKNRMSEDAGIAYTQGRDEASAAATRAAQLGFFGGSVIYNDVEAYPGTSTSCRKAVDAFMRGWVERLHELGLKAGGYGAPCTSYISDWADNSPPPDDVWIAHWKRVPAYDPKASVWDAPCLSNSLWDEHQRIKQYAGGHKETWGGVALIIDSNVLDGEITSLPLASAEAALSPGGVVLQLYGPELRSTGLLSSSQGWALVGERLLWTPDGGASWRDLTPAALDSGRILGVAYPDSERAWVVGQAGGQSGLLAARSDDGGLTWKYSRLPREPVSVWGTEAAYIHILDQDRLWVAVRLQSGSSFSLGGLYASRDGGQTWEQRSLPMGEGVTFRDELRGWTAGGPAGDQLYHTPDGGHTWQEQALATPEGEHLSEVGLPVFDPDQTGWLPVVLNRGGQDRLAWYRSRDEGRTWRLESEGLPERYEPAMELNSGGTRLGEKLQQAYTGAQSTPDSAVQVDFIDQQHGWAIVQRGECAGKGAATRRGGRVYCEIVRMLLASADGGLTWREITPR